MCLKIKNAIIAVLLTVMYKGWVIEEITKVKLITILIFAFFCFFALLETADAEFEKVDKAYRRAKKRGRTWQA